jgi:hypothetical protein
LDSLFKVRFNNSELLPQNSGKRGVAGSHFISPVCGGGGRGEEGGGAGNKRSSRDYQDCREEPDNSHLVRQGFQLFFVWGRRHFSQDKFLAIQKLFSGPAVNGLKICHWLFLPVMHIWSDL